LAPGNIPTPVSGVSSTDITARLTGPFNNYGVPGAKATQLDLAGYGSSAGNPYFARFASTPLATVVDDAIAQNPTFFSLLIGGNDVLGYATSGGMSSNPITPVATFNTAYNSLIAKLSAGGRKGAIANIPYVSSFPYFTTVPFNPVPLNAAAAAQLNSGYATYNGGLLFAQSNGLLTAAEVARRTITFAASATNKVVIVDEYLTNLSGFGIPSYRQATNEDLIVLPARSFIGSTVGGNPAQVNGVSVPLADNWVLSKNEIEEIRVATDAYNITIAAAALANNLALFDAKSALAMLSTMGIVQNGYTMTSTYVTGNAFSLDGVHPSPKGYALIANKFLEAINAAYGSNFKGVNLGQYQILYPSSL
jgi:lysophospholipase L1-like esterase